MLLLKAGVIWLSDGSPVCHSDQHPWRHTCADDMHDLNARSCLSVWLAVSGDSMQTNVSVNTRKAMSEHGRQRAFNKEQQINDTSDFTETFRCSLYRINQTIKNFQCGYGSCRNVGNACETDHWASALTSPSPEIQTNFPSPAFSWRTNSLQQLHSLRTWLHIKKVRTLSQTHIYVHTHTLGVPVYVHRQAVVGANLSTLDHMRRYSGRMPLHVQTRSKFCNKHRFFSLSSSSVSVSEQRDASLCTDVTVFERFAVSSPCQFCSSWENFHPGRSTVSSSSSSERRKQSMFQSFCLAASCFILKYS